MPVIKFDLNNLMSSSVGKDHGVTAEELEGISGVVRQAQAHLDKIISEPRSRIKLGLEWARLPWQDKATFRRVKSIANEIAKKYAAVISLGIGGSYLGIRAAQDALAPPYYNEFAASRKKRPQFFCEGNNLDPDTLRALLKNLNPKKYSHLVEDQLDHLDFLKMLINLLYRNLCRRFPLYSYKQIRLFSF